MKIEYINEDTKPKDWPANAIEARLENIDIQLERFKVNPNFLNKEILTSLTTDFDLNQRSSIGLFRTTEYEITLINSLFLNAITMSINSLKTYLYEVIGEKARSQKMVSYMTKSKIPLIIDECINLMPQLKLYYLSYLYYSIDKDMSYPDKLIEVIEEDLKFEKNHRSKDDYNKLVVIYAHDLLSIINDTSYFNSKYRTSVWAFTRDEIFKLYNLLAKLFKIIDESPIKRPVKGVLMTSISNYILKSRNDYNEDYICKYVNEEVAAKSLINNEIWMSDIKNLNDSREQRIIPELFKNNDWNAYTWVKDIDFSPKKKYYVSCFSKSINDEYMKKEYGSCVYGFKNDRISELLAPIHYLNLKTIRLPFFSQVIAFDVLYDIEQAKEEILYLCKILDCFDLNDIGKSDFLEEILQYWLLSVKDDKWSHERERRYVIFLYDNYEYLEIDINEDSHLKLKTTLFMFPDFILGNNPEKSKIKNYIDNKRLSISMKSYLYCKDCLSLDFDSVISVPTKNVQCSICNSTDVAFIKV